MGQNDVYRNPLVNIAILKLALVCRSLKRTRAIPWLPFPGTPVPGFPLSCLRHWVWVECGYLDKPRSNERIPGANEVGTNALAQHMARPRRGVTGKPGMAMPGELGKNGRVPQSLP